MFDRFTDRARKSLGYARQEAQRFHHDYIGTEHILLGLLMEHSGFAATVLKHLGVKFKKIAADVEELVPRGTGTISMLPFTPGAKRVLELSLEEMSNLRHAHIGTEHLLLGLILEQEGIAAHVLSGAGVTLEDVRREVAKHVPTVRPEPGALDRTGTITMKTVLRDEDGSIGLSPRLWLALGEAASQAKRARRWLSPAFLLAGAAEQSGEDVRLGHPVRGRIVAAVAAAGQLAAESPKPRLEPASLAVLGRALLLAAEELRDEADVDDLLEALVEDDASAACTILRAAGVDPATFRRTPPPEPKSPAGNAPAS